MLFWLPNYTILEFKLNQFINRFITNEQPNETIKFEMQPILANPTMIMCGYELLCRSANLHDWITIDKSLLNYLKNQKGNRPTLFINLTNETILTEDLSKYIPAEKRATTYIELTETFTDNLIYKDIAKRINKFSKLGLRFALDDFGSGFDGLHRYASLAAMTLSYIKFDRVFLQHAVLDETTQRIIKLLIREWASCNITTIAEGVEKASDLLFARNLGVQAVQGYFIDDIYRGSKQHKNSKTKHLDIPITE